ncbi:hypothetical protein [Vibrio sp. SCSIO 43137]|uniref:hypothetical protein n=1 Tax=Vibrio sp. SCSIO 43137 TaxID=3021011 RepID=UPI002306ED38|nr:hypothetical protein [Vibrio sp. SCSIO 43137]WCE30769.1 hypothetical protein PK654_05705 [Vibrio sp. SCSIO 43137]
MENIDMFNVKIIAALIGIIGILITAILSSFGYLYKTQLDTKKSAKRVLYQLLEIRYSIIHSLYDPEDATNAYFDHVEKRASQLGDLDGFYKSKQFAYDLINTHFQNLVDAMSTDIQKNYCLHLKKLY